MPLLCGTALPRTAKGRDCPDGLEEPMPFEREGSTVEDDEDGGRSAQGAKVHRETPAGDARHKKGDKGQQ